MRVPTCSEIAGHCICCGNEILNHKDHDNDSVNIASWLNGFVATGFGNRESEHNGRGFVIHVCDTCLRIAEKHGRAHCFYNSITSEKQPIPDQDLPSFVHYEFDLTIPEENDNGSFNKAK